MLFVLYRLYHTWRINNTKRANTALYNTETAPSSPERANHFKERPLEYPPHPAHAPVGACNVFSLSRDLPVITSVFLYPSVKRSGPDSMLYTATVMLPAAQHGTSKPAN